MFFSLGRILWLKSLQEESPWTRPGGRCRRKDFLVFCHSRGCSFVKVKVFFGMIFWSYPKPKPSRAVIRPTSVIRPSSSVPSEPVRRSVQVADSVQLFAVGQEHWKTRINSFPIRSGTERVVAVDWHQVTDTCRFGERSAARISEEYRLPDRVLQFYRQVAATKQPGDLLVVCSHIHQSECLSDRCDVSRGYIPCKTCVK